MPFYEIRKNVPKPLGNIYISNPKTIGECLRNKRISDGLLQKEVAEVIGVSEDCITNWEKERSYPQIKYHPKIIQFLGYKPFSIETNTFIGKLKDYRQRHGLSHKGMGNLIGVDASTIGSWEQGKTPQKRQIKKLDQFFGDKKRAGLS